MDQLPQLSEEEFEQIEEAIARTAKGRAFLRRLHRRAFGASSEEVRSMLSEFRNSWQQQNQAVEAAKQAADVDMAAAKGNIKKLSRYVLAAWRVHTSCMARMKHIEQENRGSI